MTENTCAQSATEPESVIVDVHFPATCDWTFAKGGKVLPEEAGKYLILSGGFLSDDYHFYADVVDFYRKGDAMQLAIPKNARENMDRGEWFLDYVVNNVFYVPEDGFWYENSAGDVYKLEHIMFWAPINFPDVRSLYSEEHEA